MKAAEMIRIFSAVLGQTLDTQEVKMLVSELQEKTVRRAMRLDPDTDAMLRLLAKRRGENFSVTLRFLIRQAAQAQETARPARSVS